MAKPSANPVGRPAFEPADDERHIVESLAGIGLSQEHICAMIRRADSAGRMRPIAVETLVKHFADELQTGPAKMLHSVGKALYETAIDRKHPNHVTASIWLEKTRGGKSEKIRQEHRFPDLDVAGATDEELAVLEGLMKRKALEAAGDARPANAA